MDEFLIQVLVSVIQSGKINPKTGEPFKSADILKPMYRAEVEKRLEVV